MIVGMLMVKLVFATFEARRIAGDTVGAVLQVTPSSAPSAALSCTIMELLAFILVVLTMQVAAEAVVAQENEPEPPEPQATREGLAEVPTATQGEVFAKRSAEATVN